MVEAQTAAARIADLETELRWRDQKIKELTGERDEALELVDKMREHVEDGRRLIDQWIDVFEMKQNEAGDWMFDPHQSELWDRHGDLLKRYNQLVREWNKLVPKYNAAINPRDRGRPLAASEAQQDDVLKRHKKGESLRAIASATSLSLRTVRTIIGNANGKGRTGKRRQGLRRKEFDRLRAAAYRARMKSRDALPGQINELQKTGESLVKAAKGLGH